MVESYERKLEAQRVKMERVKRRNLSLELAAGGSDNSRRAPKPLRTVAASLQKKNEQLARENLALRKACRKLPLAERVARSQADVAARRVDEVARMERLLADERGRRFEMQDRIDALCAELEAERLRQRDLRADRAALVARTGRGTDLPSRCSRCGAGVSLNMLSTFWRHSGISRPGGPRRSRNWASSATSWRTSPHIHRCRPAAGRAGRRCRGGTSPRRGRRRSGRGTCRLLK